MGERHWFRRGVIVRLVSTFIAGVIVPAPRELVVNTWRSLFASEEAGPGTTNPLGYDSVVDTKYLTEGRWYYCHGVCDISLRTLPALSAPPLRATKNWPTAHAIHGHTYHSICQASGERVQDDRGADSTIWALVEVEGGYRGWLSEVWFGFRGLVTRCPQSDLRAPED